MHMVFIFLLENGALHEKMSSERFSSKSNRDYENVFYFEKSQWRTTFLLKTCLVIGARTPLLST